MTQPWYDKCLSFLLGRFDNIAIIASVKSKIVSGVLSAKKPTFTSTVEEGEV